MGILLDIFIALLIIGFGFFGHINGLVPEIANLVILIFSGLVGLIFGPLFDYILSHVVSSSTLTSCFAIISITITCFYTLKIFLIPSNLAKELYIDVPFYYLSGAGIGLIRGYLWSILIFFCLNLPGFYQNYNLSQSTISHHILNYSYNKLLILVPSSFLKHLDATPSQEPNHAITVIEHDQEKSDTIAKIANIVANLENVKDSEHTILIEIITKLPKEDIMLLYRKIKYLERKKMINNQVVFIIVAHRFAIAINQQDLKVTPQQNSLLEKYALIYLRESQIENLIHRYSNNPTSQSNRDKE